ncbi:hypothetical protein GOBAR_AA05914 [Gossypium barbadense]|uniref:Uncharacterized protein n=1 Tax=Gossypium barbadense TaxID=3634 RepID=A0A2P5YGD9_GOSBA|nr:hypothetical protein GOBAR_AA05914 [Gossypium barbadense]
MESITNKGMGKLLLECTVIQLRCLSMQGVDDSSINTMSIGVDESELPTAIASKKELLPIAVLHLSLPDLNSTSHSNQTNTTRLRRGKKSKSAAANTQRFEGQQPRNQLTECQQVKETKRKRSQSSINLKQTSQYNQQHREQSTNLTPACCTNKLSRALENKRPKQSPHKAPSARARSSRKNALPTRPRHKYRRPQTNQQKTRPTEPPELEQKMEPMRSPEQASRNQH